LYFSFLNILIPIWYYNLKNTHIPQYWVDYRKINCLDKDSIDYCTSYKSVESTLFDVSYQLWHRGFISSGDENLSLRKINCSPSIFDQYIFVRRMFKPFWIYFIILYRMLSLKFTFEDISSIIKTRKEKKIDLNTPIFNYKDYEDFDSRLLQKTPLVTIIIPTLNRYEYLINLLKDLEKQDYKHYEIIIFDQSDPFLPEKYEELQIELKVIHQIEKSLWLARNSGVKMALGKLLLFLDDDSRVKPDWIRQHIKCLDYFNVDISAGVSFSIVGDKIPAHYNYFRWGDQMDTGNSMIKKEVFNSCGLFDRQFDNMRMGDGEYGARAYVNGYKIINNPKASRIHIKASSGGLRESAGWDSFRTKNVFGPRPIPSVLYFFRKYWGNFPALLSILQTVPISLTPYFMKGKRIGNLISLILFILFLPFLILQIFLSWRISTKMLENKPNTDNFE